MMFFRPRIESFPARRRLRRLWPAWLLVLGRAARVIGDPQARRAVGVLLTSRATTRRWGQVRSVDPGSPTWRSRFDGSGTAGATGVPGVERHLPRPGGVRGRCGSRFFRAGTRFGVRNRTGNPGGRSMSTAPRSAVVVPYLQRKRGARAHVARGCSFGSAQAGRTQDTGRPVVVRDSTCAAHQDSARRRETGAEWWPVRASEVRPRPYSRSSRDVAAARPAARLARRDVSHARCCIGPPGTRRRSCRASQSRWSIGGARTEG